MKVTLESTDRIVDLTMNGQTVPARVWIGHTAQGIACHAYITLVAVARELDSAEFERDLCEAHVALPAPLDRAIPSRLIL